MTIAFVLDTETVLCHQTPTGWLPIPVTFVDDEIFATNHPPLYQRGCVALFDSVTSSNGYTTDEKSSLNLASTYAITVDFAKKNGIDLPLIKDEGTVAFISYRQLMTYLSSAVADQLSQAIQLLRWQADTQFCSRCSSKVAPAISGERSMVCAVCQLRQYPRVQPCVITAITRANPQTGEMQILLAHHHRYERASTQLQYGLIAGFVEVGESLEHAVVREVTEEVGIRLIDIRYISSQPWPFPSNLMLGFRATYAGGDIVLQEDELSHADFFDISALPKIPFKGSIAYDLIAQIVQEQGMTL